MVRVRTAHFSSWYAYNDPMHRHALGAFAFAFCAENLLFEWRVVKRPSGGAR